MRIKKLKKLASSNTGFMWLFSIYFHYLVAFR